MRLFIVSIFIVLVSFSKLTAQINLCDSMSTSHYEPMPVAIAPNHFLTGYEIRVKDVTYHVATNKMKHIEFISTSDTAFYAGTFSVGTTYSNIPKSERAVERAVAGWGYEVVLKNGWTAVFNDGVVFKSLKAERNSKIGFFYKSTDCKEYSRVRE